MTRLLVEVAPGEVKRWSLLSPRQRRQADTLAKRKGRLLVRHGELLRELEPLLAAAVKRTGAEVDGPDGADTPVLVSVIESGALPDLILTPVLERELRALEHWIDELRVDRVEG
jgi:hypothetical protein